MLYPFSKNNVLPLIGFTIIALVLGLVFNTWYTEKHKINLPASGMQISQPQRIPEFLLMDGSGDPFTNHSLKGHYSFLFFGDTHMHYPMSMLSHLYTQLAEEKLPLPQIVFITLDPKHDAQKVVADYVKTFNPAFKGVTGPVVGIQQLSKQMGVYTQAQRNPINAKNQSINPSDILYLVNPAGQLIAVFSPPHKKDTIAQGYKALTRVQQAANTSHLKVENKL
jgi:protein SCO1/2